MASQLAQPEWVIVIDDSYSKYASTIEVIQKLVPQVRVYCFGNIGRNQALVEAHARVQTSHVAWLDDDDLLSVDATSVMLNYLSHDLAYSDFYVIDLHNKVHVSGRNKTNYDYDRMLLFNSVFHLTVYSMSLYNACGGINPNYSSSIDYELRLRQLELVSPIKVNTPLYYYRMHEDRMTNTLAQEQRQNFIKASNEALVRRGETTSFGQKL